VAVLGAGNVGCALTADLVLRGFEVRLFNRSSPRLDPIREAGGIHATGMVEGFAPIALATHVVEEAVDGADVIALTVPSPALPFFASKLAMATTAEQVIWLNPGQSGGALYMAAEMERTNGRRDVRICQMTTSSHGARMSAPATVRVFALSHVSLAAFPNRHLDDCHQRLEALLPGQFDKVDNVLEADLLSMNAVLHPAGMVCNAGWLEATEGRFPFYCDGMSPAVARVVEMVDEERLVLAGRLAVPTIPLVQSLLRAGYTSQEAADTGRVHAATQASEALRSVHAPPSLDHRYLHEDVGWGLVPWIHLARALGIPTPTMAALTALASLMNGVDYLSEGLTLDRMGLTGMTADEIRSYAATGRR
jgi:opine dehydrogenase